MCVVLRSGQALTEEELLAFCRPRMAKFMVPAFVEFLDEIPKTPTGKPEKYKLIAAHAREGSSRE